MTTKMNQDVKKQWLKALRSGKYKQTKSKLCRVDKKGNESFCCLGVLFDVVGGEVGGEWKLAEDHLNGGEITVFKATVPKSKSSRSDFLPKGFVKFVGVPIGVQEQLAQKNDRGSNFKYIADWIEKNL